MSEGAATGTLQTSLRHIGRFLRGVIAVAAAVIVAWSFARVVSRELLTKRRTADQIPLTVVHWGDKNEDAIVAGLVADFEARPEHRHIRVLRVNLGQSAAVFTKLQTMFAAGDPPDVFYLGYEHVADLASKDLLADMEQFIAADRAAGVPTVDLDGFFPSVLNCFRYDAAKKRIGEGTVIGLPKDFTAVGFYYNRDLFRRAGVPEPSPDGWTWDEFIAAARAVARLPGCYGADFVTWEAMVRIFLWTHELDFVSPDWTRVRLTEPAVLATLEKLQGWFHNERRTLVSAKTQLETLMEPFLAGNVGMAGPLGRWKCPTYRLIDKFDWDYAPLPHAPGCRPRNGIFTTAWAIADRSPRKKEAWQFVKYLSGERAQTLLSSAGLAIPALRSVARGPAFADPAQRPRNYRVFLDAAEYAEPIIWPEDPKYKHQFRVRTEDVFKLNKPVRPAMERVAAEWEANRRQAFFDREYPPMPWRPIAAWLLVPALVAALAAAAWWWALRPRGLAFGEELAGGALVSPWVIGFVAFTAFPVVLSLLLAFTQWNGLTTLDRARSVGLDNFGALFGADATFRRSLWVTAWYVLLAVPTGQAAALVAAMLMNRESRSIGVFRAVWYLPSVLAGVGLAVMWKWVFHHEHGLTRTLLDPILPWGWRSPAWFEKDATGWGVPAFAIVNFWAIGGTMMIYLAGLKGIPRDLYEAAAIDGAVGWMRFRHVTLPMLSPVIFFNVIIAIIGSFQVFTQAWVMTGGGPGDATRFYVVYLFNQAFDFHEMGYASAMAWLLLLIVLALTLLLMWGTKRWVYYEALK